MNTLIYTAPPPETPKAQVFAEALIATINAELTRRIACHREAFTSIWGNGSAGPTAAEIFAALGTNGALVCAVADENLAHIGRLAQLVGKSRADFLSDAECTPPATLVVHVDGTVTLTN